MKTRPRSLHSLERRYYKYWQALYLSFYSKRLFIDVSKRWRGLGLVYFLLLITLLVIPLGIKTTYMFNEYYEHELIEPIEKIPSFTIEHGQLKFDYFMPYLIKNRKGEVVVVIDEHANLTKINYIYPHWMMLVTQDHAYIRLPALLKVQDNSKAYLGSEDLSTLSFEGTQHEVFNGSLWLQATKMKRIKRLILVTVYPILVGITFGFFSILLVALAFLGQMFAWLILKFKIDFKRAYRLTVVTSTCGISVLLLSLGFGQFPSAGIGFLVLSTLYFFYALLAFRRESKQMVLA